MVNSSAAEIAALIVEPRLIVVAAIEAIAISLLSFNKVLPASINVLPEETYIISVPTPEAASAVATQSNAVREGDASKRALNAGSVGSQVGFSLMVYSAPAIAAPLKPSVDAMVT